MSLVLCALLGALVVGWLRGGSLDRLGALALRRRRLVVAALLTQVAGAVVGGPFHALGLAASAALLLLFLAANRGVRGTGLVALGLLVNALVVGANGAMPVSERAAARAGVSDTLGHDLDTRHEVADSTTRLRWLGDVVPVPLPTRPEVVSVGDVLVAAGLAQLVVVGMVGTPRRPAGRQRPLPPAARRVPVRPGPSPSTPPARTSSRPSLPPPRAARSAPRPSGRSRRS